MKNNQTVTECYVLNPYNYHVIFQIGKPDFKAVKKWLNKDMWTADDIKFVEDNLYGNGCGARTMNKSGKPIAFVYMTKVQGSQDHKTTACHEAYHVLEFLFDRIGATLNEQTSEPAAYMIAHIFWLMSCSIDKYHALNKPKKK